MEGVVKIMVAVQRERVFFIARRQRFPRRREAVIPGCCTLVVQRPKKFLVVRIIRKKAGKLVRLQDHAAEIFVENLPEAKARPTKARAPLDASDLMAVKRDFAFLVDVSAKAGDIMRAAKNIDRALITDVSVFDVYEGERIEAGKKSIAIEVTLQPKEKTLTEEEIDAVSRKIVGAVEKASGGSLRS